MELDYISAYTLYKRHFLCKSNGFIKFIYRKKYQYILSYFSKQISKNVFKISFKCQHRPFFYSHPSKSDTPVNRTAVLRKLLAFSATVSQQLQAFITLLNGLAGSITQYGSLKKSCLKALEIMITISNNVSNILPHVVFG